MNREKPTAVETGGRWLRVGMLTFTVVGPMIRTLVEFMRQPKQSPEEQAEEIQNNISLSEAMALSQLDDVALARRQRTTQQARQLAWTLQEAGAAPRFLIHDRDAKFPPAFDAVFATEGMEVVDAISQVPRDSSDRPNEPVTIERVELAD